MNAEGEGVLPNPVSQVHELESPRARRTEFLGNCIIRTVSGSRIRTKNKSTILPRRCDNVAHLRVVHRSYPCLWSGTDPRLAIETQLTRSRHRQEVLARYACCHAPRRRHQRSGPRALNLPVEEVGNVCKNVGRLITGSLQGQSDRVAVK